MDNNSVAVITRDTYSYNNNTIFYSLVNSAFLDYYTRIVRKAQQWLDGYDPSFHRDDMVSTRLASKLINGFSKSILGRGVVYEKGKIYNDNENKTLDFVNKWADETDFKNVIKQLIGYTLAFGTSAVKINRSNDGSLWCEPLRLDNFYYSVDKRNKIEEFTTFIRCFQSTEQKEDNYFFVERRFFKLVDEPFTKEIKGELITYNRKVKKPFVRYCVYKYSGQVLNNVMPTHLNAKNDVNFKSLPCYVKDAINSNYSAIKVGEDLALPFASDYLGVELFFNEGGDITNPTLPVGRSLIYDCLTDLMHYDMNKSYALRDLFNSKGIVGVPRALSQSDFVDGLTSTQGNITPLSSAYSKLNISGYELVSGLDPNTQKPIITQFEIREQEHQLVGDDILKSIANTIGVAPRLLASYITSSGTKTDDEVQSEDDNITQWIKNERQDYIKGLNNIIECVLNHQGFASNVNVRFASDGLLKTQQQLDNIKSRLELGMIDIEDAIREYYPDLSEQQLQQKIEKAKAREQAQLDQQQAQFERAFENENDNEEEQGLEEETAE